MALSTENTIPTECFLVFKSLNNSDITANSPLIFEPHFYQPSTNDILSNDDNSCINLPYRIQNNRLQLKPFFDTTLRNDQDDRPDYVDINHLTFFHQEIENKTRNNNIVSDDENENDVIFVKEYRKGEIDSRNKALRRNPVRKTRRRGQHLQKEHLLEEDLDFLDQFVEENLVACRSKPSSSKLSVSNELNKEWPINSFERPFYNSVTNKIEPFDYPNENQQVPRKPRLQTRTEIKRKPKKKYFIRKRKPKSEKPVEKVSIEEVKDLISETFKMVKCFLKTTNTSDKNELYYYDLLKNQTTLMAVVNNSNETEVDKYLR